VESYDLAVRYWAQASAKAFASAAEFGRPGHLALSDRYSTAISRRLASRASSTCKSHMCEGENGREHTERREMR
jgi:hypothetical protein